MILEVNYFPPPPFRPQIKSKRNKIPFLPTPHGFPQALILRGWTLNAAPLKRSAAPQNPEFSSQLRMEARNGGGGGGAAVVLNVYDLTPINDYLYWFGLGIFHSGIEVHGLEYAFGAHDLSVSGVFEVEPKCCPGYVYRRSVWMGTTEMSKAEFRSFIQTFAAKYNGNTYHLISKNCNHFTDDVCKTITKKSAPGWINRLARVAYLFNRILPKSIQVSTVSHGAPHHAFSDDDMDSTDSTLIDDSDVDELDQHLLPAAGIDLQSIDASPKLPKDLV